MSAVAPERDVVAGQGAVVAEIGHELVHGDAPGDETTGAADLDVSAARSEPGNAVRVAEPDERDGRVAFEPVGVPVRDPRACGQPLRRYDFAAYRHDGCPAGGAVHDAGDLGILRLVAFVREA